MAVKAAVARPSRSSGFAATAGRTFRTWPYLVPALFFFFGWQLWPILRVLWISFTDYHFLSNQPVQAGPPSRLYHLRKFVRRNRSRIAAAGLIGVLGLTIAVGVVRLSLERAARRAETASAVTQALDAAERAMRLVIPSGTAILLAFHIAYGAFFLSVLEIRSGQSK